MAIAGIVGIGIFLFADYLLNRVENTTSEFATCRDSEVFLMPHHLLVESVIDKMYAVIDQHRAQKVIIVSPNHFNQGNRMSLSPNEAEFGFTVHRDKVVQKFHTDEIRGIMLKEDISEVELNRLADEISKENALFIFSVDFSHYLPGKISYVHDLLARDVISARSYEDVFKLEIDSTASIRLLLKLLERRSETMNILKNTNPSLDAKIVTTENTTHMFGCSRSGTPLPRQLSTTMYFQHDREWYVGKSKEDRYLRGYDAVLFQQNAEDTAVVEWKDGRREQFVFHFF